MTHPDFNAILRLCLKRSNVCICTNGSFINEKKTRFLKKVEDESEYQIFFKLSLAHYEEVRNDDVRYRGAYRHVVFAIKHILKYEFTPIITVANFYNLSYEEILEGFSYMCKKNGFNLNCSNLEVLPWHNPTCEDDTCENVCEHFDCESSRVLTVNGVYVCPFLTSDYRGRCGSSFVDFNKKSSLETSFCNTCMKSKKQLFSTDFSQFM